MVLFPTIALAIAGMSSCCQEISATSPQDIASLATLSMSVFLCVLGVRPSLLASGMIVSSGRLLPPPVFDSEAKRNFGVASWASCRGPRGGEQAGEGTGALPALDDERLPILNPVDRDTEGLAGDWWFFCVADDHDLGGCGRLCHEQASLGGSTSG